MNKTSKKLMAFGLLGLTALSAGAIGVSAQTGNGLGTQDGNGMNVGQGHGMHEDGARMGYGTFDDLTEEQLAMIEEREEIFDQVQKTIDDNDYEAFAELHEDLDRETPSEEMFTQMVERHEAQEKMEQAIETGDYNLWLSGIEEMPYGDNMADIISEDEFELYTQMHELRDEANDIAMELGIDQIMPREGRGHAMKGSGQGLGEGTHPGSREGTGNSQGQGMHRMN